MLVGLGSFRLLGGFEMAADHCSSSTKSALHVAHDTGSSAICCLVWLLQPAVRFGAITFLASHIPYSIHVNSSGLRTSLSEFLNL